MGVGKNWLSDLVHSSLNLINSSCDSLRTVWSVKCRGWRKSSNDWESWSCSCPDAIVGCVCRAGVCRYVCS